MFTGPPAGSSPAGPSLSGCEERPLSTLTDKQGQYLAFIYAYTLINGRPPAEVDMQRFFRVTPPSVHRMVLELESKGVISRTPGASRSIRLLVPPEELPILRDPSQPVGSPGMDR